MSLKVPKTLRRYLNNFSVLTYQMPTLDHQSLSLPFPSFFFSMRGNTSKSHFPNWGSVTAEKKSIWGVSISSGTPPLSLVEMKIKNPPSLWFIMLQNSPQHKQKSSQTLKLPEGVRICVFPETWIGFRASYFTNSQQKSPKRSHWVSNTDIWIPHGLQFHTCWTAAMHQGCRLWNLTVRKLCYESDGALEESSPTPV